MHKILFAITILAVTSNAYAYKNASLCQMWNIQNTKAQINAYGDFVIGGCIGKSCGHGTWDDEYAVIGVVAQQIVEHGGYFCPYQLQCAHKGVSRYLDLFKPTGSDNWNDRCAWLCEAGYSGPNCMPVAGAPVFCDNKLYTTGTNGKYSGLNLKTSGKRNGAISYTSFYYYKSVVSWRYLLLGAIKFLDHGIIAAPININCQIKKSTSWVSGITQGDGYTKLLCATGYTANAAGTDCIPINADVCSLQNINMCANFDKSGYDSTIHYLEESNGCAKFFCKDVGTAFPAVGKYTCEDCAHGAKGGADTTNGVCVKCQTGQFFDKHSNSCKAARALTKTDLQYGYKQTKNSCALKKQCWILHDGTEYKNCVFAN